VPQSKPSDAAPGYGDKGKKLDNVFEKNMNEEKRKSVEVKPEAKKRIL